VTQRVLGDIFRAWDLIGIGVGISLVLALWFLIFFRFPGTMHVVVIVYSFFSVVLLAGISFLLRKEGFRIYDLINDDYKVIEMEETDDNIDSWVY
jgi:hypothetical protein